MSGHKFEFILRAGNTPLPDVVLLHLAKHYLSEKDHILLVVSGASERFTILFWTNRRKLAIGQCHYLTPMYTDRLFKQHFSPQSLTSFDVSHGYWLPPQTLNETIGMMHNLEELSIHDTKLTLADLLQVFKTCKKVLKLSLSLLETDLSVYQKEKESLSQGFGRLSHLKVFTINQNETHFLDSWPMTLEVMSWCRDCVDLHIEVYYTYAIPLSYFQREAHNSAVFQQLGAKYKSKLGWLKSLKSLVIIPHYQNDPESPHNYSYQDPFIVELLKWMFESQDLLPSSLERLWIPEQRKFRRLNVEHLPAAIVKSLSLWEGDGIHTQLDHPKFKEMEQLGGIYFSNSLAKMTQLKFVNGRCHDDEGFGEFCKSHQNLEYLYFSTNHKTGRADREAVRDYLIGDADWTLDKLKSLGYFSYSGPDEGVMDALIENCPNIEALHLCGYLSRWYLPMGYNMDHLDRIQFHNLGKLVLDAFEMGDGNFLLPVVMQCPRLKSLLIGGYFTPGVFFSNLGKCLPFAKNLRDLRLEWRRKEELSSILLLLKDLLNCSEYLERLVLRHNRVGNLSKIGYWKRSPQLEQLLVEFATEMGHLVALCLARFRVAPEVVCKVNQRVVREILPERPAFWFYLGDSLPKGNDDTIPRVHLEEMVDPTDIAFPVPPPF